MINNFTIIGRLTRNPDLRYTKENKPVTLITIAINNSKDDTTFLTITLFGKCTILLDFVEYIKSNIKCIFTTDLNGKFLYMRHGKTKFNSDHDKHRQINISYIDCHLSPNGIQQVRAKQILINKLSLEKVYVSPFYRALQTSYILL